MNWQLGLTLFIYFLVGGSILLKAGRNILRGQIFDENFLMSIATIGALFLGEYSEAISVMVLYRIGEYFQDYAVGKSRKSIADLMDIRPDYANIEKDGELVRVSPEEVSVGDVIIIKPGERVPLDGNIIEGSSRLDVAALTGESMPRDVETGQEVLSGTANLNGLLKVSVTKSAGESTAARILDLVESAGSNKGKTENFITRFARYYTPIVCALAAAIILIPPLFTGQPWETWIERGLIFLVISCPCALVISVPLSFFGGIGGASGKGILIKGGNFLEALAKADTVVFDKTGTLTNGVFTVVAVHPQVMPEAKLLEIAAHAESFSDHPISVSVKKAYGERVDKARVYDVNETPGRGVVARVDNMTVACGNHRLMESLGIPYRECHLPGTAVHVAIDGIYEGHIIISDTLKEDAVEAVAGLKKMGIRRIVMLTGDKEAIASATAKELGIDEYYAELLPVDKVTLTEKMMAENGEKSHLVFVGDGINDAPVLARADVGIAMGSLGSAAAVEAADIVLMNDNPKDIQLAVRIAKRTIKIVYQNITFALGVKVLVLLFAAVGYASMWWAIFADTGVSVLAILNAMRAMHIGKK